MIRLFVLLSLVLSSAAVDDMSLVDSNLKVIRIAFSSPWKSIQPGTQHTFVGDLTLSNQFEALVGTDDQGILVPLAAKSWILKEDFKEIIFKIDTERRFSDGVSLNSLHVKQAWEDALRMSPMSANKSALDVLYKVEGYEEFEEQGHLTGLKTPDLETLEVHFHSPFRLALEELAGNRFSIFRKKNGKYLGTGAFEIIEVDSDRLELIPNHYFDRSPSYKVELSVVNTKDTMAALRSNSIDVQAFALGGLLPQDVFDDPNISIITGQDALHRAIYLNNQPGFFFEKKEFRLAFQYLAFDYFSKNPNLLGHQKFSFFDPQIFLPLQAGRLQVEEVHRLVELGKQFVSAFVAETKRRPLVLYETTENSLRGLLDTYGLEISKNSRVLPKGDLIAEIYSGKNPDLTPGAFGVVSGDPDGIYHILGKNGSITSPMYQNSRIAGLLEVGRKIYSREELHEFYKNVSRATLEEVPFIHNGFSKGVMVYRNDRVKVKANLLRRNQGHLFIYDLR